MKTSILTFLLINFLFIIPSFAQNDDGKKVEFLIEARSSFFTVDNKYSILKDTIFHADNGFRVYSDYDIIKDEEDKEFVVFRYPKWSGKNKQVKPTKKHEETISTYELIYNSLQENMPSSEQEFEINKVFIDSLLNILEKVINNNPVHAEITGRNNLMIVMSKKSFDNMMLEGKIKDVYSLKFRHSTRIASGFMTIPFKFRPKEDTVNFNITTDVTLGAYLGIKKRISRRGNNFLVLPVTLGLSYINVGNNETSSVNTEGNSSVVPGITWSSGLVLDLNGFNVGLVIGQDFASGVGDRWIYNKQFWFSFTIGYSFFSKAD